MRIAQVNLQRDWGGAERHVSLLSQGLRDAGEQVVVCCHPRGGLLRDAQGNRMETRAVTALNQMDLSAGLRLAARLYRFRPDVVHVHTPKDFLAGYLASRLLRGPVVALTRHMMLPLKPIMRHIYRRTDAVLCLSAGMRAFLEAQDVPPRLLRRVRSGIDQQCFGTDAARAGRARIRREWGIGPDDVAFGVVGRLVTGKGHSCLLRAAQAAEGSKYSSTGGIRLIIIGDGPEKARLEQETRSLDLCHIVSFSGFVNDIPAALAALDCVVLASESELLPLSVMEAMASALPVIATDVGGLSELVEPEITGLLVRPEDPAMLAADMVRLAKSVELRDRMGAGGRERARADFTLAAMVSDTLSVYRDICRSNL